MAVNHSPAPIHVLSARPRVFIRYLLGYQHISAEYGRLRNVQRPRPAVVGD